MEKKAIYAVCISIIAGFIILGTLICYGLLNGQSNNEQTLTNSELRYEMVSHGSTILIFDKQTGDYWQKFLPQNEAPTQWEKFESPSK